MKTYYIAYTTHDNPYKIVTEEIDFQDDVPINQSTIAREIESIHNGWYDRVLLRQVISWSEVQE